MNHRSKQKSGYRVRAAQQGVGLVEILVAVLIGMIGVLAVFAVFAEAENYKRSTASGTETQIGGAVALNALARDIRLAGYGFGGATNYLGCPVAIHRTGRVDGMGAPEEDFVQPLLPVSINNGGGPGGSDIITVWYGNSNRGGITQGFATSATESKTTEEGRGGYALGDAVLVAAESGTMPGANDCPDIEAAAAAVALVQVSGLTNPDNRTFNHAEGAAFPLNNSGGPDVPSPFSIGRLYNLGPAPRINLWSINAAPTLQVQELLNMAAAVSIGENIIDMQAEYGFDTALLKPGPGVPGAAPNFAWTPTNDDGSGGPEYPWHQLRAIRVALLVRSGNWEREAVTATPPSYRTGDPAEADGRADFALPVTFPDGTASANYRYRVYETVIPLRNMQMGERF